MFRTISTMLSYVPRAHEIGTFDNLRNRSLRGANAEALKIIEALSRLANTNQDVVAAAAKEFKGDFHITTCVQNTTVDATQHDEQPSGTLAQRMKDILSYLFVVVRNDKIHDPSSHSKTEYPYLIDAEAPPDLNGKSAIDYIVGLQSNWWVLSDNIPAT